MNQKQIMNKISLLEKRQKEIANMIYELDLERLSNKLEIKSLTKKLEKIQNKEGRFE